MADGSDEGAPSTVVRGEEGEGGEEGPRYGGLAVTVSLDPFGDTYHAAPSPHRVE